MPKKRKKHIPLYRKRSFVRFLAVVLILVLLVVLAFRISPWPGAMIIRYVFTRGGHKTLVAMQKAIPHQQVTVLHDQQYAKDNNKEYLDVYIPNSAIHTQRRLPVVIWTHGGAWLSGDKKDAAPYYSLLASQSFIVVALNYSLAPETQYPTPPHQLNDAYAFIARNAERYHINMDKIALAGDSAGSQLSSQMAAIITNPTYAKQVGITPQLKPDQLAAVALWCGIYKMEGLTTANPTLPKIITWGDDVTIWAYLGTRDKSAPVIKQASPYYHVTKDYPAVFISGGNADPLTSGQSVPFASKLTSLGVPVSTLFYPTNYSPKLPHEYQFTYDSTGKTAFAKMVTFLNEHFQ